jgi:hypothetical protein
MGDGVTGAGNAPPTTQTTNAGQNGTQSQAGANRNLTRLLSKKVYLYALKDYTGRTKTMRRAHTCVRRP